MIGEWQHREYSVAANGFGRRDTEPIADPVLNGERYPAYSRLDVSFRWDKTLKGKEIHPFVQFVNVYNRRNIFLYTFDYRRSPGVRQSIHQMPFLPSIGLEFVF